MDWKLFCHASVCPKGGGLKKFLMRTDLQNIHSTQNETWDMIIEPQRSLLDLRLGEL
jgi:hypothetical protein